MQQIAALSAYSSKPLDVVLTIGNFDGVHLGHRAVLKQLLDRGRELQLPSALITFDPHPLQVLKPGATFRRLFSITDLAEQASEASINYLVVEPFTQALSKLSAEKFLDEMVRKVFHFRELVVGHDFHFGSDRSGHPEMLRSWCSAHSVRLHVVPPFTVDGERVSSRGIRDLVASGDVERAARLLGRPYAVTGVVAEGHGRGRNMGTPTLNLKLSELVLPKRGVYVSRTRLHGQSFESISNLGVSPTFGEGTLKLETHLLTTAGSFYGQTIVVELLKYLRDERAFESIDDLKTQIALDVEIARRVHREQQS